MLVIISDIHLGDGTTANAISPTAFDLFSNRLRETAYYASFRRDVLDYSLKLFHFYLEANFDFFRYNQY